MSRESDGMPEKEVRAILDFVLFDTPEIMLIGLTRRGDGYVMAQAWTTRGDLSKGVERAAWEIVGDLLGASERPSDSPQSHFEKDARVQALEAKLAALIEAGDEMRKALVGHTGSVCCTEATAAWSEAKGRFASRQPTRAHPRAPAPRQSF